ncbi:unnamed protein product, partial [Laminaria digitata]
VIGNYVHDNGDAGLALMESFNADVSENTFENNKYGVRLSVGCADNVFHDNIFTGATKYNVYTYEGSDSPSVVDSGRPKDNIVRDNIIIGGGKESVKLTAADGTQIINNAFDDPTKIRFEDNMGTVVSGNTGLDGVKLRVTEGTCFGAGSDAEYIPVC